MEEALLLVENLSVEFTTGKGTVRAVRDLNLKVREGEILGLVGESGCGKSATLLSILQLLPPPGRIAGGQVKFRGRELTSLADKDRRAIRGKEISMVFQDPMSCLNPAHKVGDQILEVLEVHGLLDEKLAEFRRKSEGPRQADEGAHQDSRSDLKRAFLAHVLSQVGIPSPETVIGYYPHQLSGGMQQRVVIAIALVTGPKLILMDEPTTALDVTLQAQILELVGRINRETNTAVILVTHDLAVASRFCHRIAVMYAGEIVEEGPARDLIFRPLHPYTKGLLDCIPRFEKGTKLVPIPGQVPDLVRNEPGCSFYERCQYARDSCRDESPNLLPAGASRQVRCSFWFELESAWAAGDAEENGEGKAASADDQGDRGNRDEM